MSRVPCQTVGMRNKQPCFCLWVPDETIGCFGQVRLVRKASGQHDLVGGSPADRQTARKWCRRFAKSLVFVPARSEQALTA